MIEEKLLGGAEQEENKLEKLERIMHEAGERHASDIHLAPGSPVMLRVDGDLEPMSPEKIKPYEVEAIIKPMLTESQMAELEEKGELDFAYSMSGFNRLRVNVFRQRGTYAMALRILSFDIPNPGDLGIPDAVIKLTGLKRGLVLITGATGSGKSTTLAALIGLIARTYAKTIITLEDPVEYIHQHNKSMVLQREVGGDTMSYANALKAALRQDPDVILVGEMRDLETISTAITAAETGHLVFSTLHTNSAADSIDRVIDVFPPHQQQQIRIQLAGVIEGVVAQQLLPVQKTGGRVAAYEVMLSSPAISNLIREGKAFQIPSMIQTSRKEGMQTMDDAIYDLYMRNLISAETAIAYAHEPNGMRNKVQIF
ncbi:type IV pilus twitching motility protein PilT [Roseburia sp. 499]|uniref:type IV pilus twitching motility protein PilT n=1 Tax=Roseburia sp. 499 TaxID=1261634 RepID=UPI000953007D|nr:type IV pilus twitching motility protein PilT [Roseburia sp. 499]WVK70650.1 type IV pilus twitching motility protein PilT [Roseburia sp. 499]